MGTTQTRLHFSAPAVVWADWEEERCLILVTQTFCVGTETKARLQILNKQNDNERKGKRKTDTERYNEALCPSKILQRQSG